MVDDNKSWMRRRVEGAIRRGLTRTYDTIKVDPRRFLMQLRVAHGLPLATFQGVYTLPLERLDDVAESGEELQLLFVRQRLMTNPG